MKSNIFLVAQNVTRNAIRRIKKQQTMKVDMFKVQNMESCQAPDNSLRPSQTLWV